MSPVALALTVCMTVMMANQVIMRFGNLWRIRPVFLGLQTVNAVTALAIALFGVPGFETWRLGSFLLAFMFAFRIIWNNHERNTAFADERRAVLEEENRRVLMLMREQEEEEEV